MEYYTLPTRRRRLRNRGVTSCIILASIQLVLLLLLSVMPPFVNSTPTPTPTSDIASPVTIITQNTTQSANTPHKRDESVHRSGATVVPPTTSGDTIDSLLQTFGPNPTDPTTSTQSADHAFSPATHHLLNGQSVYNDSHGHPYDQHVVVHLQSSLRNDTCILSSQTNGTTLIMSCPGCILFIPMHQSSFDVELFFAKAINYAYFCSALTVIQIYFIYKQMKSSESSAASSRLCRYTVGMQGMLDGYQTMFHLLIAFNCEALFNAFLVTSFLQFIACVLFEMHFLQHLYKTAFPADFEGGWERNQRARKLVNIKFYSCMMLGLAIFYIVPYGFVLGHIVLYGYWVPQIVWQAVHGFRRGFNTRYILSMTLTRLILPAYFLGCPMNFLNHETDFFKLGGLTAWSILQVVILACQRKFGARFLVPKRFISSPYDYYRSIPMTQFHSNLSSSSSHPRDDDPDSVALHVQERQGLLTEPSQSIPTANSASTASDTVPSPTADEDDNPCSICFTEFDPSIPRSIMVCPCNHIFHTTCLTQWMKQKMACPVCRSELPPIVDDPDDHTEDEDGEEDYSHPPPANEAGQSEEDDFEFRL